MSHSPKVSIIMGSTSDLPIMRKAIDLFEQFEIPYEVQALSAHRTPSEVADFAHALRARGVEVVIAAAGMAAHLPGVIAAMTPVPVIGVPINSSLDGMDALLSIAQMPPGVPVATVGINAALNAALLAAQMIAVGSSDIREKYVLYKEQLKKKIVDANSELAQMTGLKYKTN